MLRTSEVATLLNISRATVKRLIESGELQSVRLGNGYSWHRIQKGTLNEYAARKGIELDWSLIEERQTA